MRRAVCLAAGLAALAAGPAAAAAAPQVRELVVYRDGSALQKQVSTRASTVRVDRRRCTTGNATALSALVRSRPGPLRLRDFGSCSGRSRDAAGLFVRAIRGDVNRGQNGWVYKVGRRAATAGAGDPGGPFGRGRLRAGQRVTWFYCRLKNGGCQRTLAVSVRTEPGTLVARVRGYDDQGSSVAVEGATVTADGAFALTDSTGEARLNLPPGSYRVLARKEGAIRSFTERVALP